MLDISHQSIILEDGKPVGVIINIETFQKMESIIEDHGLAYLMDEVLDDEELDLDEAIKSYISGITYTTDD